MGIKNLFKIIKKYSPNSIKDCTIKSYTNKTLAIDACLMIYKSVFALKHNGYDLKNDDIITTHIHTLLVKILGFMKYQILPIFVFDGESPIIKEQTIAHRKEYRKLMLDKYNEAITHDEKKKYFYRKAGITNKQMDQCKDLIKLFGFPVIECKGEADPVCAYLAKAKMVDAIVTDDMDILLFGGTHILKNFTIDEKKKFQEINLAKMLTQLELSHEQLIELGILLGTDYNTIKGLGTMTAYKKIKEYGNIHTIIENNIVNIDFDYKIISKYFAIKIKLDKTKLNKKKPDYVKIFAYLQNMKFSKEYMSKYITKAMNYQ